MKENSILWSHISAPLSMYSDDMMKIKLYTFNQTELYKPKQLRDILTNNFIYLNYLFWLSIDLVLTNVAKN